MDPTNVMARRVGAYVIDLVLMSVVGAIAFFAAAEKVHHKTTGMSGFIADFGSTHYPSGGGVVVLVMLVYSLVAFVAVTGTTGASPGKALVGIRVVDAAGNVPGIGRAI